MQRQMEKPVLQQGSMDLTISKLSGPPPPPAQPATLDSPVVSPVEFLPRGEAPVQVAPAAQDTLHIAYTAAGKVFNATLRSMLSLGLHNEAPNMVIHLLVPPADVQVAEHLKRCLQQQLQMVVLNGGMPKVEITMMWKMPFDVDYPWSESIAAGHEGAQGRLFLQEYLPQVSRIIYLDSDTLVLGDLSPLFARQMNSSLAAGLDRKTIRTVYGEFCPTLDAHVNGESMLFNDGVLLLDLARWRSEDVSGALTEMARTVEGATSCDQLMLNIEFQGRRGGFDRLDPEWNTLLTALDMEEKRSGSILHFIKSPKPWDMGNGSQVRWFELFRAHWRQRGPAEGGPMDASGGHCTGFQL